MKQKQKVSPLLILERIFAKDIFFLAEYQIKFDQLTWANQGQKCFLFKERKLSRVVYTKHSSGGGRRVKISK